MTENLTRLLKIMAQLRNPDAGVPLGRGADIREHRALYD